jgi:glycosyltransferase involved in cell wall biosynthesis
MLKKISVVMPTYNHGKYIKFAIDSVLKQTYINIELIIIDNFSTDETEYIIKSFSDKRIIYNKLSNNGIIAKSRNLGILLASGYWVAFIDSDDYWTKDKLYKCFCNMELTGVNISYHKLYCHQFLNNVISQIGRLEAKNLEENTFNKLIVNGTGLTTSAFMIKLSCIKKANGFREDADLVGGEDYDLWMRLAKSGEHFLFINEYMGSYLIGGNHVTSADRALKIIAYLQIEYKKEFESTEIT